MPRFYFHVHDYDTCVDEEGTDLPALSDAQEKAVEAAREFVCDDIRRGFLNLEHRIDIADAKGNVLLSVTFRDAFSVRG